MLFIWPTKICHGRLFDFFPNSELVIIIEMCCFFMYKVTHTIWTWIHCYQTQSLLDVNEVLTHSKRAMKELEALGVCSQLDRWNPSPLLVFSQRQYGLSEKANIGSWIHNQRKVKIWQLQGYKNDLKINTESSPQTGNKGNSLWRMEEIFSCTVQKL